MCMLKLKNRFRIWVSDVTRPSPAKIVELVPSHTKKSVKQNITKVNYLEKHTSRVYARQLVYTTYSWCGWLGFYGTFDTMWHVYQIMCCHCKMVHILNKLIKSKYVHLQKNENDFIGYITREQYKSLQFFKILHSINAHNGFDVIANWNTVYTNADQYSAHPMSTSYQLDARHHTHTHTLPHYTSDPAASYCKPNASDAAEIILMISVE